MSYIVLDSLEAKKSRPTQKTMKLEAHQFNGFAEVEGIDTFSRMAPHRGMRLGDADEQDDFVGPCQELGCQAAVISRASASLIHKKGPKYLYSRM